MFQIEYEDREDDGSLLASGLLGHFATELEAWNRLKFEAESRGKFLDPFGPKGFLSYADGIFTRMRIVETQPRTEG